MRHKVVNVCAKVLLYSRGPLVRTEGFATQWFAEDGAHVAENQLIRCGVNNSVAESSFFHQISQSDVQHVR